MDRRRKKVSQHSVQRREVLVGADAALARALLVLPPLSGDPIRVEWQARLRIAKGRLLPEGSTTGIGVHAATYLVDRRMILDKELRLRPAELQRILVHELAHFVWRRLGNPRRTTWEEVILREWHCRARGELGWSAERRKKGTSPGGGRAWREYLCESFCDSVAYAFSRRRNHPEFTLAAKFRAIRLASILHLIGNELKL